MPHDINCAGNQEKIRTKGNRYSAMATANIAAKRRGNLRSKRLENNMASLYRGRRPEDIYTDPISKLTL